MKELLYLVAGAFSAGVVYVFLKGFINSPLLLKQNYSGKNISTVGGLVALIAIIGASAIVAAIPELEIDSRIPVQFLFVALGFSLLGLLDDLGGDKDRQGFKGHIASIFKGKVTTGALKLFGGPLIAFIALSPSIESKGYMQVIIGSLVISLFANLSNLFDLAPGRSIKFSLLTLVLINAFADTSYYAYLLVGVFALVLALDLRELFMLGDTGSNLFGSLIGFIFVASVSSQSLYVGFIVLIALNALSELVSFSKLISSILPLRIFDQLGQRPERIAWNKAKRESL